MRQTLVLIILLILLILFVVTGCDNVHEIYENTPEPIPRFKYKEDVMIMHKGGGYSYQQVYIDQETNIEYLYISTNHSGSMTRLWDK